jgi:hypothetical protein
MIRAPRTPKRPAPPAATPLSGYRRAGQARSLGVVALQVATIALLLSVPAPAFAETGAPVPPSVHDLPTVIANLQAWVMGILAALATLFLVLAGVYWATAGGDPAQVDKAKGALKNALIGYGLTVLAPVLLSVVKGIVGG